MNTEFVCVTCRSLTEEPEECLAAGHKVERILPITRDKLTSAEISAKEKRRKAEEARVARNEKISKANR